MGGGGAAPWTESPQVAAAHNFRMPLSSPLRDRAEFVVAAAVLGVGAGVLNLAYSARWGAILALVMLPALPVRVFWRTMPGWLLLAWVMVPTFVGEMRVVTQSDYLVVTIALAVAAAGRRTHLDTAAMIACVGSPFLVWIFGEHNWNHGIGAWIWFGGLLIGWGFGHVVGQQWALIAELERTRTRLAETAVAEDRQRIAGDLHDLVGHSFSVVLLHLSGARMVLDSSPTDAAEALRQAEAVGRSGMDELRQALMLMRRGRHEPAVLEPGDLDRLLARYRDAGMRVNLRVDGDVEGIAAAPRIVLHDVLREALTNVAKHAAAPEATVRIGVDRDHVTALVSSPLPARVTAASGMGLAGLEHRVAAIDGTFGARPSEGRWLIEARLPRRLSEVTR